MNPVYRAMTIAGSDSGAGAGIQADLKTFAANGVYGSSILTAITAQNTQHVTDVLEMPVSLIKAQIDAVVTDIGTDAVKIGMLSSSSIIEIIVEQMKEHELNNIVVDPVMVAKGGDRLLREDAVDSLRTLLVPIATLVTPNIPEAQVLTDKGIKNSDDARDAARDIFAMGPRAVVVKGGHLDGPASDIYFDGREFKIFESPRIITTNTHGTGCTFSSAIAAGLAKGMPIQESVAIAKEYVTGAIRHAVPIGRGHGPLNHFYHLET